MGTFGTLSDISQGSRASTAFTTQQFVERLYIAHPDMAGDVRGREIRGTKQVPGEVGSPRTHETDHR